MHSEPFLNSDEPDALRYDPDIAGGEPSHIHIPRPSRVKQSTSTLRDDGDRIPVQLALVEEAA